MSEPKFCYLHPTRIAKRKCFQCRRPLCPDCQKKIDHHLFCSDLCHKDHLRSLEIRPVRAPYLRFAGYAALFVLFSGLVYFGLLADAFYSGGDKTGPTQISSQIAPSLPVQVATEAPAESVTITRPVNGMKSPSQKVEVEGRAPQNAVVAVYLNGTLVESTVAHEGNYRFPGVLLTKHANVLQTRYYSDNGSSNFSPAIMVLYQEPLKEGGDWKFFQNSADNVARGNLGRKELVLTFDGGSDANSCANILRVLKQNKIHTTMFLTGEFIEKFPEHTREIAAEHEVGNHTYSHSHLTTYAENLTQKTAPEMTREELQSQLRKTEEIYYQVTGKRMVALWRAPYGEHNLQIRRWAAEIGYTHVAWTANPKNRQNLDSLDWVPNSGYPGYFPALLIKDRILSFGQNEQEQANGGIVLMHLGTQRAENDRVDQWLPEIIKTFRSRGYDFISASTLVDRMDLLPNSMASKQ